MTTKLRGELEIDHERGVIYFHLTNEEDIQRLKQLTVLRICQLPLIPSLDEGRLLDIMHMYGTSWSVSEPRASRR